MQTLACSLSKQEADVVGGDENVWEKLIKWYGFRFTKTVILKNVIFFFWTKHVVDTHFIKSGSDHKSVDKTPNQEKALFCC